MIILTVNVARVSRALFRGKCTARALGIRKRHAKYALSSRHHDPRIGPTVPSTFEVIHGARMPRLDPLVIAMDMGCDACAGQIQIEGTRKWETFLSRAVDEKLVKILGHTENYLTSRKSRLIMKMQSQPMLVAKGASAGLSAIQSQSPGSVTKGRLGH